jgi:hypothetical protein
MRNLSGKIEVIIMYEFRQEAEKKEIKSKVYLYLFAIAVVLNTIIDFLGFGTEKISDLRVIFSLLCYGVIFYFGLQRKLWAQLMIKFIVWLNVFLLVIIIVVKVLSL